MMVRHSASLFALFSLALLRPALCASDEKPCTAHADGKFFDLNPLKASKDYEIKTPNNEVISLNVCQNVKTDLFGIKDDSINAGDVQGFIRRGHGDFIIGKVNTTLTVFDGKPRFVMSGGSRCKSKSGSEATDIRASAMVQFHCDISSPGTGTPKLIGQLPPGDAEAGCAYLIEWKTHFACPASEGGFLWNFFAITSVIFLVLLMTYTVLGTLYNRFVLQLRGFDQIPQFSIESMKYHGREAVDWIKDMVAAMDIGGRGQHSGGGPWGGGGGAYAAPGRGDDDPIARGPVNINPFSHQSQVSGSGSGFGGGEDAGGPKSPQNNGGFIRPQSATNRANAFSRMPTGPTPTTNPVSHQTQVLAGQNGLGQGQGQSLSFSDAALSPRSPPARSPLAGHGQGQAMQSPPRQTHTARRDVPSAPEERDFMLGDDDDEDAEELGDVSSFVRPSASSYSPHHAAATSPSATSPASALSPTQTQTQTQTQAQPAGAVQPNPAAAARGRDLGNGEVIRL